MATINSTRVKASPVGHNSYEGGKVFTPHSALVTLRIMAASSFFGEPKFYQDKTDTKQRNTRLGVGNVSPANAMEAAIDAALNANPEETLKIAVELRTKDNIRVTPQVILVRAAHHPKVKGTGLIRQYAPEILGRTDEPATGLAYHLSTYKGKPLPNSLKRAWKTKLESVDAYQLAKYRMEDRQVKTVDVVNMVHAYNGDIDKLVKGELKNTGETWEAILSAKGKSKESWEEAITVMGHMALLRNLRNFEQNGVDPRSYLPKLVATAPYGKQIPFRYLSAYAELEKAGAKPQVLDAIEECLEESLGRLPKFAGRVISLADNSGSMWGANLSSASERSFGDIANLSGIITGKISEEGYVGIFGSTYKTFPVTKRNGILFQTKTINIMGRRGDVGHSTHITPFFRDACLKKEHWDHIFIYSDMQVAHTVMPYIDEYRSKVNPKVMVYMVQVAGYADTLMPDHKNRSFTLGGWSSGILHYAAKMDEIFNK